MEHRDFLQIQIDQLGQALSKLFSKMLGIKEDGQTSECLEAADQSLKKELGFNIDDLTALSTDEFIETLQKKELSSDSFDKLADILLLLADEFYQTESGNEKSKNLYLKCLRIYQHLKNIDSVYPFERQLKIERIKKLMR
jgi:hypothetical protein